MKEIQVSKFQSSISFPIPINKGVIILSLVIVRKMVSGENLHIKI